MRLALPGILLLLSLSLAQSVDASEYTVRAGDYLAKIAKRYPGVSVDQIKAANGLTSTLIYPGQRLVIPDGAETPTVSTLPAGFSTVATSAHTYTVRSGDSLARIAQRNPGVSIQQIKRANGLTGNMLQPGQKLKIPEARMPTAIAVYADPGAGLPVPSKTYTVIKGDSLYRVAARFQTTVQQLRALNGITGKYIHPGQVLKVPGIGVKVRHDVRHAPMTATQAELEILARIIKGETPETVSMDGHIAVAAVLLNRVRSPEFKNTIAGVAHAKKHFSCYNPGERARLYWGKIPSWAWEAARAALAGQDPTGGSTHYFNPYIVIPRWAKNLEFVLRIGTTRTTTHDFYRVPGAIKILPAAEVAAGTTDTEERRVARGISALLRQ